MPINIGPKKAKPTTQAPATGQQADLSGLGGQTPATAPETPAQAPSAVPPPTTPPQVPGHQTQASFLMTGGAQQTAVQQVKAQQDLRSKLRTGVREFWLNPGEFAKGVFLDGTLLSGDVFDTPMVAVHMVQIGGDWHKVICNKHTEGSCVVCDSNADGSQPMTLQLFTFINVMPYTIQNGPNKGKTMPARLQLFAANLKTRTKLIQRAKNHGNTLAGGFYQFSRGDKQEPRTGGDIEFLQTVDLTALLKKFPMLHSRRNKKGDMEDAPTTVYDYATVYPVLTNAEIAAMRPDLASMAGFTAFTQSTVSQENTFGGDPTGELDDELPF
jgi:hypothetical protein